MFLNTFKTTKVWNCCRLVNSVWAECLLSIMAYILGDIGGELRVQHASVHLVWTLLLLLEAVACFWSLIYFLSRRYRTGTEVLGSRHPDPWPGLQSYQSNLPHSSSEVCGLNCPLYDWVLLFYHAVTCCFGSGRTHRWEGLCPLSGLTATRSQGTVQNTWSQSTRCAAA